MTQSCLQALWNTFCSDCNSMPFRGINASGNDGAMWDQQNLHSATSWGCLDDSDGNSACQIQLCGRHVPAGVSPTDKEELFAGSGVILPRVCGITNLQGDLGPMGHMSFKVQCGQMSKLTICVGKTQEMWYR